jgi:hypothetical protein
MQCALKRFGPGIVNTKTTAVSKEVNINLQKMMAERAKQDTMWDVEKKNELNRDATKCASKYVCPS